SSEINRSVCFWSKPWHGSSSIKRGGSLTRALARSKDLCSPKEAFIYALFDRCERLSKPSHFSAVSVLPFESLDEKPTSSFNPDVMTSMHESLLYTLLFFKPGTEFLIP